jgi:hypothetical protein
VSTSGATYGPSNFRFRKTESWLRNCGGRGELDELERQEGEEGCEHQHEVACPIFKKSCNSTCAVELMRGTSSCFDKPIVNGTAGSGFARKVLGGFGLGSVTKGYGEVMGAVISVRGDAGPSSSRPDMAQG